LNKHPEFSFTIIEETEDTTKVSVAPINREIVELLFESYGYEIINSNTYSFIIEDNLFDVFNELNSYEIDESSVLTEEANEDTFHITPMDDVFEIQFITTHLPVKDILSEDIAKKTIAVRGGKRKIIFKCGPGQMKVGRVCRRRPTADLNKMKRRAKISARKSKSTRRLANRKRKISLKRRAILVKKPKPKTTESNG
jgi:hypothetical protein